MFARTSRGRRAAAPRRRLRVVLCGIARGTYRVTREDAVIEACRVRESCNEWCHGAARCHGAAQR
eukprot:75110-Prymnesium_polylepis.1